MPSNPYAANMRKFYIFNALHGTLLLLPIWVVYLQEERGLSLSQVTAMEGPFWVAMVLLEVPTGAVADRFGRKTSLALGMVANAIAIFIFGVADSYPLLFASYLLWAGGLTLISGADAAFVYDSLKAAGRQAEYQRIFGRVMAVQAGALMVGTVAGAALAAVTNLWLPILVTAGFHVAALGVCLTFKEPPQFDEGQARPSYIGGIREATRLAWNSRAIRYLLLAAASGLAAHSTMSVFAQPFLRHHGVEVGFFGLLFLPGQVLGIAGALVAYRLAGAIGDRWCVVAMVVAVIGAGAVFSLADTVYAFAALPAAAFLAAAARPLVTGYLNARIPSSQRATILSYQQLVLSLMLAGLVPAAGAVADRASLPAGYAVVTLVAGIAASIALVLWLRADRFESTIAGAPVAAAAHPAG